MGEYSKLYEEVKKYQSFLPLLKEGSPALSLAELPNSEQIVYMGMKFGGTEEDVARAKVWMLMKQLGGGKTMFVGDVDKYFKQRSSVVAKSEKLPEAIKYSPISSLVRILSVVARGNKAEVKEKTREQQKNDYNIRPKRFDQSILI